MGKRKRPTEDPLAQYTEWAANRYNPGHWVGGKVPPDVKNLWSPKDRRRLGSLYVGTCAIGLALGLKYAESTDDLVLLVVLLLPTLVPGLIMLFACDPQRTRRGRR